MAYNKVKVDLTLRNGESFFTNHPSCGLRIVVPCHSCRGGSRFNLKNVKRVLAVSSQTLLSWG